MGDSMSRTCLNPDDSICRKGCAGNYPCEYAEQKMLKLENEVGHVRHSYDRLSERMEQEIERAKGPLAAERDALKVENARLSAAAKTVVKFYWSGNHDALAKAIDSLSASINSGNE